MEPTTHPPADILFRFLDGRLPRKYGAEIEQHISECGICLAVLERGAFTSPLLATLRKVMPEGESDAPDESGGNSDRT